MKASKDFDDVTPSETVDRGFDWCDGQLSDGETVSSAVFTIEVAQTLSGATPDDDPSSRKSGAADVEESDISGIVSIAVQRLTGMIAGNKYRIIGRATTSNGQLLEIHAHMMCKAAA